MDMLSPFLKGLDEETKRALMMQAMLGLGGNLLQAGGRGMNTAEGLGGAMLQGLGGLNQSAMLLSKDQRERQKDQALLDLERSKIGIQSSQAGSAAAQAEAANRRAAAAERQAEATELFRRQQLGKLTPSFDDYQKMTPDQQEAFSRYMQATHPANDPFGLGGFQSLLDPNRTGGNLDPAQVADEAAIELGMSETPKPGSFWETWPQQKKREVREEQQLMEGDCAQKHGRNTAAYWDCLDKTKGYMGGTIKRD